MTIWCLVVFLGTFHGYVGRITKHNSPVGRWVLLSTQLIRELEESNSCEFTSPGMDDMPLTGPEKELVEVPRKLARTPLTVERKEHIICPNQTPGTT